MKDLEELGMFWSSDCPIDEKYALKASAMDFVQRTTFLSLRVSLFGMTFCFLLREIISFIPSQVFFMLVLLVSK